jgi:hypothetical protein
MDFAVLVQKLKAKDKKIIIFAYPQVSRRLTLLADKYDDVTKIPV